MDSVLSAAGLLLAVLGVLYGLWYPEVAKALDVDTSVNPLDAAPHRQIVSEALVHRAIPLALGATILFALLLPPVLLVIDQTWTYVTAGQRASLATYDAVGAFVIAVELFTGYLAFQTIRTVVVLKRMLKTLRSG